MIKLSACIEMLFRELPFEERVAAAAEAGLQAVEFWGWDNKDLPAVAGALAAAKLPLAGLCIGTRDEAKKKQWGARGLLDRRNHELFLSMIQESAAATADLLNVRTYIVTVGQELPIPRYLQHASIVDGLRRAAPLCEKLGITLVVEPLNPMVNHRGYYLASSYEAFDILRQVESPAVKLLFDIYHQQITEGNLIDNLTMNAPYIGHIHVADVPGRNQPGTGEIAYDRVLAALNGAGYGGYVGLEYLPKDCTTAQSLAHIKAVAAAVNAAEGGV